MFNACYELFHMIIGDNYNVVKDAYILSQNFAYSSCEITEDEFGGTYLQA